MNKYFVNFLRIIAATEFLLGLILFSKEIINYFHLPTIKDVDNQFGGIVDFFKYRESCYKNLFLYSLLIITGISFWMNKKTSLGTDTSIINDSVFRSNDQFMIRKSIPFMDRHLFRNFVPDYFYLPGDKNV